MATSGQLIVAVAEALGITPASVAVFDRALSEAGIRTKGGRGRSAAQMTSLDAANLLIAVISSPIAGPMTASALGQWDAYASLRVKEGLGGAFNQSTSFRDSVLRNLEWLAGRAQSVSFRNTHGYSLKMSPIPRLLDLPGDHTLADAVAAIFDSIIDGSLITALEPNAKYQRFENGTSVGVTVTAPSAAAYIELQSRTWAEVVQYRTDVLPETRPSYGQQRWVYFPALERIALEIGGVA